MKSPHTPTGTYAPASQLHHNGGKTKASSVEAIVSTTESATFAPARKLITFDAVRYLTDDAAIAEYMSAVLEADEPDLLLLALADVARARGMAQVAKDAGLGRESLYKALTPGAKPRYDTIMKVMRALGVQLTAKAA